jgi:hypothetical protein
LILQALSDKAFRALKKEKKKKRKKENWDEVSSEI